MAKTFGAKFDIISPVWLQIQQKGKNKYEITGTHDIDTKWIQDVRQTGASGIKSRRIFRENSVFYKYFELMFNFFKF